MENATKALLIAAAVLVAIMLITLGLNVFQQGQNAVSNADMTDAEIQAYNTKFTTYEGSNRSVTDVNALTNVVLTHNQTSETDVEIKLVSGSGEGATETDLIDGNSIVRQSGSDRYTITCELTNGLVSKIKVQKNS